MKRILIFLILLISLTGCSIKNQTDIAKTEEVDESVDLDELEEVENICDLQEFDYLDLKAKADIVARVRVLDNLSRNNSECQYTNIGGERYMIGCFSRRKLQILEIYKNNNKDLGNTLTILEMAGISKNTYYHDEGYEALKKGEEYIFF